jgi:hypothetical protein
MTDASAGKGGSMSSWLARLRAELPPGAPGGLTSGETAALLDLAREAAHQSERIAAPLTTFLVGVAFHDLAAAEREARIRRLIATLAAAHPENT